MVDERGFKKAKADVLVALNSGNYLYEIRNKIEVKNKLSTGEITATDVAHLVKKAKGFNHSMSPHHSVPSVLVHTITVDGWYIKFYFIDPDTFFISVHQ